MPYNPRQPLESLARGDGRAFEELWTELFHQGDVGLASYAAVPHLVKLCADHWRESWQPYALVASIELARDRGANPEPPDSLNPEYRDAISELARVGLEVLPRAAEPELVRAILSVVALSKGLRTYSAMLLDFSEDEIHDRLPDWFG